jgi:hypothetical protein
VAVAGAEPHAGGAAQRQNAEAIVLDLVQPAGARQSFGGGRQAGRTPID